MRTYYHTIKQWTLAAVSLAGTVMLMTSASCNAGRSMNSITVGIQPLEYNALLYIAESRSFFKERGLKLIFREYDNGLAAVNGLLKNEVDIACSTEFAVIRPVFEKQQVRIIAVSGRYENVYLIARRSPGINNATDLKGKMIGVIRGTVMEFYLGRYLKLHGMDFKDVTILDTINSTRCNEAIVNGEIDAVVTFQPNISLIQAMLNNKAITWRIQNNQLTYGILVSMADLLGRKGETVVQFLEALAEAEYFRFVYPYEARVIVQDSLKLDKSYLAGTWPMHRFSLSLDFSLIIAMNDEARWIINNNLTTEKTIPDFRNYIYVDALKKVKPDAVNIIR